MSTTRSQLYRFARDLGNIEAVEHGYKRGGLRGAGLLGSMGSIGDCFDNSVAESFFGTLQLELLDEHRWASRQQRAQAIFDWIEAWYNPRRRHSYCKMLSPVDNEAAYAA